ncbi:hypothetical protein DFH07DRAFT_73678 [Mycena maculata]|uniref:Uncharacterized protein n=1 Tax=Mycena maculata TaxID=230809 RepID=A0AAD7K0T7_9AGAR|nr:hypothetical protein DFH07DRAFT_73678 [Mycena maculata]
MFSRSLLRPIQSHSRRLTAASYSTAAKPGSHTTDSYSKEYDSSPAADSKIHRVDPSSENVQKPHEPPSGPWSQTGVDAGVKNAQGKKTEGEKKTGMKEYSTMSAENPYHAPKETQFPKSPNDPNGQETSSGDQGPQGSESGGRKPEGR